MFMEKLELVPEHKTEQFSSVGVVLVFKQNPWATMINITYTSKNPYTATPDISRTSRACYVLQSVHSVDGLVAF